MKKNEKLKIDKMLSDISLIEDILYDLCCGNYHIYSDSTDYQERNIYKYLNNACNIKDLNITIDIPENIIFKFIGLLNKELKGKVKTVKDKDYVYGILIDRDNEYGKNILKEDVKNSSDIIVIHELRILTILNSIYKYNDMDYRWNKEGIELLKEALEKGVYKHQTTFEKLMLEYHFDCAELSTQNPNDFEFKKEQELTWYKYFYPRVYYYEVVNYFVKLMPKDILCKYGNDYEMALMEYEEKEKLTFEDEIVYDFYKLVSDAKTKISEFYLDEDAYFVPRLRNLIFIENRVHNGKNDVILEIINDSIKKNLMTYLFAYEGDEIWYTSHIISKHLKVHFHSVMKLLNPFNSRKFYASDDIDERRLLEALNFFKESSVFIYEGNYFKESDELECVREISGTGAELVIIDSLDILMKESKKSLNDVLKQLNSINKKIIICERPKDHFNFDKKISLEDIKYYNLKTKYSNQFYSIYMENKRITISNLLDGKSEVI